MTKVYDTYGREVFCDLWGVSPKLINNLPFMYEIMARAAESSGATVFGKLEKEFHPNGLTVLLGLEESHLTAHSYPDREFLAINCYTCGSDVDPDIAIDYLIKMLEPKEVYRQTIIRGVR